MNKIPPNPCSECYADYSETCHKECEEIILYSKYRNRIDDLIKQGFSIDDAVKIVNEQYKGS